MRIRNAATDPLKEIVTLIIGGDNINEYIVINFTSSNEKWSIFSDMEVGRVE